MHPTTIGLDLAKSVFQIHGVDAHGKVVTSKRLRRDAVLTFFANLPPCTVGMEACGTAHYWARELRQLGHGRERRSRPADAATLRETVRQTAQERPGGCRSDL